MINPHFHHAMMRNYGDVEHADLVGPFVGIRPEMLEMHDLSHPLPDKKRQRESEDDQVYFAVFPEGDQDEKKPKLGLRRNSAEKFGHLDPLLSFDLSTESETHETGRAPFLPHHPLQAALDTAHTDCAAYIPAPPQFIEACNEFHHTNNLSDMLSLSNHPAFSEFGDLVSTNAVQAEAAPSNAEPLLTKIEPVSPETLSPASSGVLSLVHDSPVPTPPSTEVSSSVKALACRLVRLGELADKDPDRARIIGLLNSLEGLSTDVATLTHRMDPTSPCPAKPVHQTSSSQLPGGAVASSGMDGSLSVDDDLSVRLPDGLEELWYADRPYPTFNVEVSNSGGYCPPSLKSARVQLSLLDGDMNDVSDKLGGAAALQNFCFSLSDGRTEIHGLRFLSVSSKCGGHFHLVVSLVPEDNHSGNQQAKPFVSKKIQVLSYRLFHSPKVDFEKLRPSDSISKMKGIGNLYAKRFTSLGVISVQHLAELDVEGLHGQEQGAKLLEYLRRDRGAMTLAKLNTYIAQARDIVQRYNSSTTSTTTQRQ